MIHEILVPGVEIYCGNAQDIVPTLGPIDSLVTDPPYGMGFVSNHRTVKYAAIENDLSDDLLLWACSIKSIHSSYIFCRWNNLGAMRPPKSVITWLKDNWSMGDLEHEHGRRTELILFYAGSEHFFPKGRPHDVISSSRTGNTHHPSEKPLDLMAQIVRWTNGTVTDFFMGSGSTGVAAVMQGRKFIGIESDPSHYRTARERIIKAIEERDNDLFTTDGKPNIVQDTML